MGYGPACREPATYRAHYLDPDFNFRCTLYLCDGCMRIARTQKTQIPGHGPLRFYRFRNVTGSPSHAESLRRLNLL